jgi:UDP-N-acetylmuramate dehydrogenase
MQVSLLPFNTFGIDASCSSLSIIKSEEQLISELPLDYKEVHILGGGSNILCASHIQKHILKNEIRGISVVKEDDDYINLTAGGGENWHHFVLHCLEKGFGGLENLSLIPGTVGAAPVQNIGAYGVEQDQLFVSLRAIDLLSNKVVTFSKEDCQFSYRDSLFKSEFPGRYFITQVEYRLTKRNHIFNTSYGAIEAELERKGVRPITIGAISDAVIAIRTFKLPDPSQVHNAGSFFKNPIISETQFDILIRKFPDAVHYRLDNGEVKVPAGWLIDQCGFKGMVKGRVGTYKNQALVLVNHGGATGEELWAFAMEIQDTVRNRFDIELVPEVNLWGF